VSDNRMGEVKAFTLHIPDADIADLRARLARTRYPDEPPLPPWSTGTSLTYLKSLLAYWQTGFDWRAWEAKLNGFRQFTLRIRGIDLHFIHEPSRRPNVMPLLLSHGWPGSLFEFHKIIPLLTEHFTVVAPSLPGYPLSFRPGQPRFGVIEIAEIFAEVMGALGYTRFGAQGGDWGSFIASVLGHRFPQRVAGIHLNLLPVRRDPAMLPNPNDQEKAYLAAQQFPQGGNRLPVDPGNQAADARLRAHRFACRARRVDRGKVSRLDRQRRQPGRCGHARRDARQHRALLVHRRDRLVVLALLRAHAWAVADPGRRDHQGADGLCGIPQGNPEPAAFTRGEDLRHPPLDAHAEGRAFRRARTARSAGARGRRVLPRAVLVAYLETGRGSGAQILLLSTVHTRQPSFEFLTWIESVTATLSSTGPKS